MTNRFCNKYVSSLWLMLSPWIIRTLSFPPFLASLMPCNFPLFHLLWHAPSLSYCYAWSCSWHRICGKATVHNSFIHVTHASLQISVHRQRHSHRVLFFSNSWVVVNKSVMIFIIRTLSHVRKRWWRLWFPHKSGWDSGRKKRERKEAKKGENAQIKKWEKMREGTMLLSFYHTCASK